MSAAAEDNSIVLEPGSLWPAVLRGTARGLSQGALMSIPTECSRIVDGGVSFVVRVVERLEQKRRARSQQERSGGNPFLPPDPDLFVAELSRTHVCVLNKFNVFDHHLLIVTREFEDQENPLTQGDFAALRAALAEVDALGFYNSGVVAGASQPHKHLQLVPVPLDRPPQRTPIDPLLAAARFRGPTGTAPGLPFAHALTRLDDLAGPATARELLERYRLLLAAAGLRADRPAPYNLLVTRDTMLLVPRRREHFDAISVNALGFAGSLLARNRAELDAIRRAGPLRILRHVALPVGRSR